MKFLKFKMLLLALAVSVMTLSAQDVRTAIEQNPNVSASNLLSYTCKATTYTDAPKGFKPFYISTYGRHGSRWHTVAGHYDRALRYFANAAKQDALTDLGKDVYERMKIIKAHSEGREGQLTQKGVQEHRGIAERMVRNFPEIFSTKGGKECNIECLSTLYPRCLLSMAANNERIKELNPKVNFTRTTGERYKSFMSNTPVISMISARADANYKQSWAKSIYNPDRLLTSLFTAEYIAKIDKYDAMLRIFRIAGILQNMDDLDMTLYDIFTTDELYAMWRFSNVRHYALFGPSKEYGDHVAADAVPLMRHIIADVDDVIANGGRSGFLRFGHDMIVVPLINMLELEGRCPRLSIMDVEHIHQQWQDVNITSMAANVQMVFYRNKQGEVLVKVLHNEVEANLPFASDIAPYYRWEDFRNYYTERMEQLDKLEVPESLLKYAKKKSVL